MSGGKALEAGSLRGIHLDLKYQVPNKAYLTEWVKRLPEYGINSLLIEYEDAFPYERYPFLRAPDAFTPAQLKAFLGAARGAGLTLIPLVQSYAHLEFALCHPQLAHLREKPDILAKVCARHPESAAFVRSLVEEVMAWHAGDPFFHLGGDEVWHTEWCERCQKRLEEAGPSVMWGEHVAPLLEWVLKKGKRPIIWDDIFWKEPEAVGRSGLPEGTILHAWNYGITSLAPKGQPEPENLDLGGPAGVLKQVDRYREAGFDVIAAPCYNVGQLFTRHTHSLKNTRVWAQKMKAAGGLGMLNTAWACFHMPLQTTNLHVAATGALCRKPEAPVDAAWQEAWLEGEFGAPAAGMAGVFETLGEMWEIPAPAYERPFTPIVYGYMSMVFHYPGRHKDRQRRGAYPRDWNEIDFTDIYRKGLEESRKAPDMPAVYRRMDALLAAYPAAVAAMRAFAAKATRRRDEVELMAVFAELKWMSRRMFAHLLRGDGDRAALRKEALALEAPLDRVMAMAWEPFSRARLKRAFFGPMAELLRG